MTDKEELKQQIATLEAQISELEGNENEDDYNDFIDEVNGEVTILGMSYCASRVLKEVDPIAYNCGHSDYNDGRLTDLNNELEELKQELKDSEEVV